MHYLSKKVLCVILCATLLLGITIPPASSSSTSKIKYTTFSMKVGSTKKLTLSTKKKITWTSNHKSIVSIKKNGSATAHKIGTAIIKGKYGNISKYYKIKVVTNPIIKTSPTPQPTNKPLPTLLPTASPKPTSTPSQTPIPTATPDYSGGISDSTGPALKDLYAKSFLVGAAINGVSSDTAAINHTGMRNILIKHFNSTTMSNLMKPVNMIDKEKCQALGSTAPNTTTVEITMEMCKAALDFCKANQIKVRGHVLIWHNQTPKWFFKKGYSEEPNAEYVTKEVMKGRMENYIKAVLSYCQQNYPGVIYCWDVVNECVDDSTSYSDDSLGWNCRTTFNGDDNYWYKTMGTDYVFDAFRFARKYAAPGVSLFYNDYNVFLPEKRDFIIELVTQLKRENLIDGIGLQPTVTLYYPTYLSGSTPSSFQTCLEKYATLGLEIQITELSFELKGDRTASKLKLQADRYEEMYQLLLKMDTNNGGPCNITSVSTFGICDDYPLYTDVFQNLYLWNKDATAKEAFYRVRNIGVQYLASLAYF